ncbi:Hint domain-containing protein [Falsirhodobacter sp. 20TX0035]|uniref:Hint domain-containing protein n=1 Tax=Falsirhodobacter sp. 20TX0035 TaxID=3022019 RepID=UPI00232CABDB|nr:Hint domain-containing protein [Falsirhodobacter sp. 20TX0035]MDB6454572.1 Hint domain-containing protein [Falsirhodobacter sp. 20TX0035]
MTDHSSQAAGSWAYRFYDHDFTSADGQADAITSGTLSGQGYASNFEVDALAKSVRGTDTDPNNFGVVYTSTLKVTEGGTYTFDTASDDGSRIVIRDADGKALTWHNADGQDKAFLDNDYHQGMTTRSGTVELAPGTTYTIEVVYWENEGSNLLHAHLSGPDTGGRQVDLATSKMIGTPPSPYEVTMPDGQHVLDMGDETGFRTAITQRNAATGAKSGTVTLADGTVIPFSNVDQIICFTPGAKIHTLGGTRTVDSLQVGDMVVTRDHGLQPIRWIGRSTVPGTGRFAPIRLRPRAIPNLTEDLLVSPQHRMLIEGYRAQLLFAEDEVLAPARHMVDGHAVTVEEMETVTYIHLLFDRHEVIWANGAATESYHPGGFSLDALQAPVREELFAIFPELRALPDSYGRTARRVLKAHEVRALDD